MMYFSGQMEFASMYCLNAAETDERIGRKISVGQYGLLADVLYVTRDNEKCIHYARKIIELDSDSAYVKRHDVMSQFNTIICVGKESAILIQLFYFDTALHMLSRSTTPFGRALSQGTKVRSIFPKVSMHSAKPLLESDYRFSKGYGEFGNAPTRSSGWHESI
jgi:hypothetical protein